MIPRQSFPFAVFLAVALGACAESAPPPAEPATAAAGAPVRMGIEVLLTDSLHLVRGRRVGLITNHTGVHRPAAAPSSAPLVSTIDALHQAPEIELVALFAPEHGIRGDALAGELIDSSVDPRTGVPIHSLYGQSRRPSPEMLEGVDLLLFDMQDVGARYYTYVSTMAYAMEVAGASGIPFVVLDRPDPVRGDVVQGNVLDPAYATFVGLYPVPMRHGMTAGELARLYVGEFGIDVELHVVPVDGWRRDMTWDDVGLEWIPPSPNIPTLESALHYPGTCLFEGTPLSVGRGTDHAFEWVGAPWIDGDALAAALSAYDIEGVRFEPATFTPRGAGDGKFDGQEVHGVRLFAESSTYDAPRAAVAILVEAYRAHRDRWTWNVAHFDRLAGTDDLRLGVEAGQDVETLVAAWTEARAAFERTRTPYLIY